MAKFKDDCAEVIIDMSSSDEEEIGVSEPECDNHEMKNVECAIRRMRKQSHPVKFRQPWEAYHCVWSSDKKFRYYFLRMEGQYHRYVQFSALRDVIRNEIHQTWGRMRSTGRKFMPKVVTVHGAGFKRIYTVMQRVEAAGISIPTNDGTYNPAISIDGVMMCIDEFVTWMTQHINDTMTIILRPRNEPYVKFQVTHNGVESVEVTFESEGTRAFPQEVFLAPYITAGVSGDCLVRHALMKALSTKIELFTPTPENMRRPLLIGMTNGKGDKIVLRVPKETYEVPDPVGYVASAMVMSLLTFGATASVVHESSLGYTCEEIITEKRALLCLTKTC